MDLITQYLNVLGGWIWGPVMLVLLVGTGLYFTIRLRFMQFTHLPRALAMAFNPRQDRSSPGSITQFQSLMTALAGTIGTGNIAGVATAVVLGGPGAVLWMWMTALVGMMTKFAEALLAVRFREDDGQGGTRGGPMYYIERGLGMKWLAVLFALFGMIASLGTGCSVQSNSVAHAVHASFGVPGWATGMVLTVVTALVIVGGIQRIGRASSYIVPFMSVFYVLGGLAILAINPEKILPAISIIFSDAFSGEAVAGGVVGTVIRYGMARGVFSNEAGIGTAPIAAAAAKTKEPVDQALVSMTGTFLDTIVVCSITGIVLVMGGLYTSGETGAALTTHTFESLLPGGGWIVTIGLIFFAYSTILGWCYYGEKCAEYLLGSKAVKPYRLIYTLFCMLGTVVTLDLVWAVSDVFNGLMAFPNLIGLLLLSGVVIKETKSYLLREADKKN